MSWLSEMFSSGDNQVSSLSQLEQDSLQRQIAYYAEVKKNNPTYYETVKDKDPTYQAEQKALAAAGPAPTSPTAAPAPPVYSGPTAEAKLQGLLPSGFENTLIPSTTGNPLIESLLGKGRGTAQSFIDNMVRRGTLTDTGKASALTALSTQDPGVRNKLTGISQTLLEGERGKLRGIANEGYGAASGQSGETFDPSPYYGRANTEAAQFLSAFPSSYTTAVGDTGGLYDTSGLGAAGGGVTRPQNVSFDPYAVEGGKLSTGLDESGSPPPSKKRSTSVF